MLRVLDLFSGIGGFSFGLERTSGFRTVAFCETDPFCRRVLAKHWPEVPILEDIRSAAEFPAADVVCGGFPCQDISIAGPGAGLAGARSGLWREMVRAVRLVRPLYAIVENVAALLGRGMGTVLGDLAESGYDTEWDCIPACAVGAEHERDRVFVVAYPNGPRQLQSEGCEQAQWGRAGNGPQQTAADAHRARRAWWLQTGANSKDAGSIEPRLRFAIGNATQVSRDYWAHQPVLGRGFHGVPNRLDRIAALGNAVVPQIPELIGRAILAAEAA